MDHSQTSGGSFTPAFRELLVNAKWRSCRLPAEHLGNFGTGVEPVTARPSGLVLYR
ncbi:MAG: hypothetical protein ACKOU6_18435 [Planctomycetota bacterium]